MRPTLVLAGLVTAGLLTACGSPTEPEETPATSPSATAATTGHGAYAECLAEHGISTPPAGPVAPSGVDPQTWAEAQQACADKAPGPTG